MIAQRDMVLEVSGEVSEMLKPFVRGAAVPRLHPVGVEVRYGINQVPSAMLDLTPGDLPLICDFDAFRRSPVRIKALTVNGCLDFEGLLDGLSVNQSPGALHLQLEVKHPFQVLKEINPKLLGYHASGVDFTARVQVLRKELSQNEPELGTYRMFISDAYQANLNLPFVDGMLEVLRILVKSQLNWQRIQNMSGGLAIPAIQAAKLAGQKQLTLALGMLDRIDTSYVKTKLTLRDHYAMDTVLQGIVESQPDLWSMLLSLLDRLGCGLTIARDRAFVVPMSGFLRRAHPAGIPHQAATASPNQLYPAQYTTVAFNDNGYRDVVGVYLVASPENREAIDGFYQDPTALAGQGGILGLNMPYLVAFNSAAHQASVGMGRGLGQADVRRPSTPATAASGGSEADQAAAVRQAAARETQALADLQREQNTVRQEMQDRALKLANEWAEQEYYKVKLADRIGSLQTWFQPRFVPGAPGTVYLRHPGAYIDFFVTGVQHALRLQAPGEGMASTAISFNCGRLGGVSSILLTVSGLEEFVQFIAKSSPGPTGGFTVGTADALAGEYLANQNANLANA